MGGRPVRTQPQNQSRIDFLRSGRKGRQEEGEVSQGREEDSYNNVNIKTILMKKIIKYKQVQKAWARFKRRGVSVWVGGWVIEIGVSKSVHVGDNI